MTTLIDRFAMAEPFVELLETFLVELMFFPEHLLMLADLDRVRGKAIAFLSNKMVDKLDAPNAIPFFMVGNLSTVINYKEEKSLKGMLCHGALLANRAPWQSIPFRDFSYERN
jgi:hypothetical protein